MPKAKITKKEVLQKVIPIFRARGVQQSSMSELAKGCGIQKSHFYYYFKNKEELIQEVLTMVHSYFQYNLFRIIKNSSTPISDKMKKIRELLNTMFKNSDGGCIMANIALETMHLSPIYSGHIRHFFDDFITGIQLLLETHHSPSESKILAEQIVQDIEGGILLMRIYDDHKYLNNAIARMEKLILQF